jgi:prophage antirepressor-like protein
MKTIRMTDQLLDAVKAVAQYEEVSEQELCASVIHDAMKAKLKLAKESAMQKAQSLSLD